MRSPSSPVVVRGVRATWITVSVSIALLAYVAGVGFTQLWFGHAVSAETVVLAGAGVCVGALGVGYQFAQRMRRRLYDIEEAAALIAAGRLHHRVSGVGSRDEIDRLAVQFNHMGETLEQQVNRLQQLAEENRRLAQDAERAATMEERQRLARELHDSVSQALFALSMMAESALRQADSGCGQLRGTLTTIADMANQAQREMRALLLHLRPVELAGRTFVEAASAFLRAVEERYGLHCTFACDTAEPMPPLIEEHLFRILQESLANVLKHANARHVRVQVLTQASAYELSVTDDGVGLPASEAQLGDTFGIAAMRERAESLGGRFRLLRRDRGTTVSVVIPRTGAGDAND